MQVFVSSCSSLKPSCEDIFSEKATGLFPSTTCFLSHLDLFARSAHAKTDKRCFFFPPSRQSPQRARLLVGSWDTRFGSCNWFNRLSAFYLRNFDVVVFKASRIPIWRIQFSSFVLVDYGATASCWFANLFQNWPWLESTQILNWCCQMGKNLIP